MGRLIRASRILIAALAAALLTIAADPAWAGIAQAAAPTASGQAAKLPLAHAPAKKQAKSPHGETVVTFAWGGGKADQMQALPIFREFGMHATYFIPSGLVCTESSAHCATTSPYLTLPDIHKIASYGNEIGGLSVLHRDLTLMPTAEAQREVCNDRMNLLRWGFHATDFAYPFAAETPQIAQLTRQCGYNAGLGAGELRGAGACDGCALAETIPPQNPMLVRAPDEVNATIGRFWSVATYQNIVTDVKQHGGGWIFFTIHDVCSKACAYGITPPELRAVLSWLRSERSHNVKVQTMRQVIGGAVRPAVAGPVARPVPRPGVINSTLADTDTKRTAPLCFQQSHYGQNDARFNYSPSGGPNGEGAVTVHITKWASGGAYFLPKMDLGQCAPPASPGRQYTVGAWYKSNHTTQLAVYYRNQVGDWLYWTTSTAFPATSSWKKASWTTPAVPAGATAVTFGLTAAANMTITSTAYNMAPAQTHRAIILLGALLFVLAAAALITRGQIRYRKHIREEIAAEEQHHGAVA
jgi:peptidoglycan/xylan/chitin deacetylase (PgdA/CDA1 family)